MSINYQYIYTKITSHNLLAASQKMKIYEGLEKQYFAKKITREEYNHLQYIVQNIKSK